MSETIDYAEMLEIPVNTLNVTKKRSKRRKGPTELKEQVVETVNERVENAQYDESVAEGENITDYGEPRVYSEEEPKAPRKKFLDGKVLIAEFVAICALCATILLTNLFWENSAINTFFRGLVTEDTPAVVQDDRTYSELTLYPVVSDTEIVCTVSDTGVLTFQGECSVYAPYGGTVQNVAQGENGYTVEVSHTTSFTTVITGLTHAYVEAGETVFATIPVGFTDGSAPVSVSMYDAGSLITSFTVNENNDIVWNV